MKDIIERSIKDSISAKEASLSLVPKIEEVANLLIGCIRNGNKILICGNGGSASQAQHFSAEIIARFEKDRRAMPALSLTTDTSNLTAIANDYSFDDIFSRQVEGLGKEGDVLVGITTSGNSGNVLKAFSVAKSLNIKSVCLNGKDGGKASPDFNLVVPHSNTARIQEVHILIIHILCKLIEEALS